MKIETIRDWIIAALAIVAVFGIIAFTGDYEDRMIDETVKEEAISQAVSEQKKEASVLRAKKIELAARAEYMTTFPMVQK